jgi:regulator of sigma E protease
MLINANFTLVAILAGIVVIGVLIFVHELGHFLAAKSVGIAVLRFSFGLGPRTPLGVTIGETDYCLSWIPFGGFVKMAGIEEFEQGAAGALEGSLAAQGAKVPRERTFDAKPLWARTLVIVAGVAMNALFAVVVYAALAGTYGTTVDRSVTVEAVDTTALPMGAAALKTLEPGDRILRINGDSMTSWHAIQRALLMAPGTRITVEVAGWEQPLLLDVPHEESPARAKLVNALTPRHEPVIGEVLAGGPAAKAGLEPRDRIVEAGGVPVPSWDSLVHVIQASPGRPLPLVVARDTGRVDLTVVPQSDTLRPAADSAPRAVGRIGVSLYFEVRHFGFFGAIGEGLRQTGRSGGLILVTLKGLLTGQVSARDLGGPILVGQLAGEVARLGLADFLAFMAFFSINLAILNLLPIPVLDGGHLVFLAIEGVRGRALSLEQRQRWTQLGFFVLVAIMVLALANDVLRLFH